MGSIWFVFAGFGIVIPALGFLVDFLVLGVNGLIFFGMLIAWSMIFEFEL